MCWKLLHRMLSGCCGLRPYTLNSQTSILDAEALSFQLHLCVVVANKRQRADCRTACATHLYLVQPLHCGLVGEVAHKCRKGVCRDDAHLCSIRGAVSGSS